MHLNHKYWHVTSQWSWPKPSWLPHLAHKPVQQVLIDDMNSLGQWFAKTWTEFGKVWLTLKIINGKKDWKHLAMQEVVTMNNCCDVIACLTFNLPHSRTGSFHSHQHLYGNDIHTVPLIRWSFAFHKADSDFFKCGVQVHNCGDSPLLSEINNNKNTCEIMLLKWLMITKATVVTANRWGGQIFKLVSNFCLNFTNH